MVQLCKRWCVVYAHDGSPMDGCLYVHKDKAEKRLKGADSSEKFRVERVAIMSVEMAEKLISPHTYGNNSTSGHDLQAA